MKKKGFSSRSVHGGKDIHLSNRPEAMPIYQTSVFTFDDLSHMESYFEPSSDSYLYSRDKNPNPSALEQVYADLEGGEAAVVTSSGMAGICAGILSCVQAGDHVLCSSEIYGVTGALLEKELNRLGVEYSFASFHDLSSVESAIQPNTKAFVTEVVANPLLTVMDIGALADLAHAHQCQLIVDSTFTSPYVIRPLEFGADIVVHSATKYLNGHNDVTAGVVISDQGKINRTREIIVRMGCNLGPFEAWLALRGIKTFALRMKQHCENGMKIAQFLAQHPKIEKVYYPGLPTHPTFAVAEKLLDGRYGGMVSFKVVDDKEKINRFIRTLESINLAPSLAGVASTLSHPMMTSHRAWSPEKQQTWGITMGLLRLSVGIEDAEDIIADLEQALEQL
ncbi:trans-sulfuration enzyme family protein [Ammoniphilus resinae]|uniref:Cystathionine beta-lyase/cystathionine gamma-synthase n=1 Tax=Ammoniphilus resinae TaxID=861532 RepID=A0ABS4GUW3_9BACL|nr:aminotransferase class I/II-fold pyridoxal phosphate-dependent enzyme [Ammoniphilus resinae]MBP1934050.1 cystathionine beta-lyase/cystathionine gamma-synthase [Ammoniphilus resinae]